MVKIAIPIERKTRERDGKVWLSMNLASRGHDVILGKRHHLYNRISDIQPDFVLHFKANESTIDCFQRWKNMGISIGVLETEGAVFPDKWDFLNRRCNQDALDYVDIYFAWGNKQKEWIEKNRNIKNVVVSGNPRCDLTKDPMKNIYKRKAVRINQEHGEFVLVNGNFGIINHGRKNPEELKKNLQERYPQQDVERMLSELSELFDSLLNSITYLAQMGLNVVVRPHQTEDISTYEQLGHENISVEFSGDVREWIIASQAVIHNSCTTGIESTMLGIPTYSYVPIKVNKRPQLPNDISVTVRTKEKLYEKILEKERYETSKRKLSLINDYFNRYETRSSAEIITSYISSESYSSSEHNGSIFVKPSIKNILKDIPGSLLIKNIYYFYLNNSMNMRDRLYLNPSEINESKQELQEFLDEQIRIERMYKWDDIYQIRALSS